MKEEKKKGWLKVNENERNKIMNFCDSYIQFLNQSKTEREACKNIESELQKNGFKPLDEYSTLKSGDKVYYINNKKAIFCAVIGKKNIIDGLNIVGSHIDSPRIDLKPNPIYEDAKLCLFKTHYYGGIKKYQWTTIPLSLHGIIYDCNNQALDIHIGEKEEDPIFTITDLLPHLSKEQNAKKLSEAIEGEGLNVLIGSIPNEQESSAIKKNILNLLKEKYNLEEDCFTSAELELVPAFNAKSLGFDRSMIAGYGQDDRVCAYTSLQAVLEIDHPETTAVTIFADKEEIGSYGNTGMMSERFDLFVSELLEKKGELTPNALLKTFNKSKMLSADVGTGVDPNYISVSDIHNASYIGYGIDINKYTGSQGKAGASDANAEYLNYIRTLLIENDIDYQVSELGKVDLGGGGTIAYILANKGVEVLDCGVPIISMHSPYEVTSKYDIYSAYRAYKSFLNK